MVMPAAKLRAWQLGGGIEFDALKTDVHGVIGWEHHNFLGGLRTFSVVFRPGLVLYPLRVTNLTAPTDVLLEEKLKLLVSVVDRMKAEQRKRGPIA